jgi:hypothetical protein
MIIVEQDKRSEQAWRHRVTSSVAVEPPIWHGLVTVVGRRPSGRLDEGRVDRASRHQQDITE